MMTQISKYINDTVMVSIPAVWNDIKCRPYKLIGVDLQGLWLQSVDLTHHLLSEKMHHHAAGAVVFVPYSHIAGVLVSAPGTSIPMTPKTDAAAPVRKSTFKTIEASASPDAIAKVRKNKRGK